MSYLPASRRRRCCDLIKARRGRLTETDGGIVGVRDRWRESVKPVSTRPSEILFGAGVASERTRTKGSERCRQRRRRRRDGSFPPPSSEGELVASRMITRLKEQDRLGRERDSCSVPYSEARADELRRPSLIA